MFDSTDSPPASAPALTRSSTRTLTEQLAERFAARIRDRLLAPGARLPSVRQCAAQHGLNPSTVVAAYDLLLAQGLVEARPHRGFFVRERAPQREAASAPAASRMAAPISAATLIRGMFHPTGGKPQPGAGVLPPEWLETTFMPAAVRKVSGNAALADASLRYGEPMGDGHLRRVLAARLQAQTLQPHPAQGG